MGYSRDLKPIARRLLAWYRASGRDLPWRHGRDPYRVWVSEIMLQQTTVKVVVPYYERFLARFPDVSTLSAASIDDVLACWAGLGYYRRARHLKDAADAIVRDHQGRLPSDEHALRRLPGFGPYTAAAVAAIAFDAPTPPIDGNLRRVAARLFALLANRVIPDCRASAVLAPLYRTGRPSDLTQALMDLGATICLPVEPRCDACPIARFCRGRKLPRLYGRAAPRARSQKRFAAALLWIDGEDVLLAKGTARHFEGMWDVPVAEASTLASARRLLSDSLPRACAGAMIGGSAFVVRHTIMTRRITRHVWIRRGPREGLGDWICAPEAESLALTSAGRKTLAWLLDPPCLG